MLWLGKVFYTVQLLFVKRIHVTFATSMYHSRLLSDTTQEITSRNILEAIPLQMTEFVTPVCCTDVAGVIEQSSEILAHNSLYRYELSDSFYPVADLLCKWKLIQRLSFISTPSSLISTSTYSSSLTEIPLVDRMSERVSCDLAFKYVSFSALRTAPMSNIPVWFNRETDFVFSRTSCNDLITEVNKSSAMILARWLSCVTSRSLRHDITIIRIDSRRVSFILGIFFNRLISSLRPRKELEME